RPAAPDPVETDPVGMSWLILEARGHVLLKPLCNIVDGDLRLDLATLDVPNLRLVVVASVTAGQRFATLVTLLGSGLVAGLCRAGVAVEVHCWGRRPGKGWLVEVHQIGPADFAGELTPGDPSKRPKNGCEVTGDGQPDR